MGLEPVVIVENYNQKDTEALKKLCVDLCVSAAAVPMSARPSGRWSQSVTLAKGWYLSELRKGGK